MPSPKPPSSRQPQKATPSSGLARLRAWLRGHPHQVTAALASTAVCIAFGAFRFDNFPLDDAYIHLSYGKYFQLGNLFSFNGDGPDTGTSSWTWTLICILLEQLRLPAHGLLTLVGMGSLAVAVGYAMSLTEQLLPPRTVRAGLWPYGSALLILANGNIIWLTLSGMETLLAVALVLAFVHRVLLGRGLDGWAGAIGLAMVWTRVECLIWLFATLTCLPLLRVEQRKRAWWAALPLGGLALSLAYNQVISGSLLPTSAAGKRATFVDQTHDLGRATTFLHNVHRDYVSRFLEGWDLQLWVMLAAAMILIVGLIRELSRRSRRRWRIALGPKSLLLLVLLGGTLAHTIAYLVHFRTVYHHFRYFAPLLVLVPALVIPCTALALVTLKKLTQGLGRRPLVAQLLLLLETGAIWTALLSIVMTLSVFPFWLRLYYRNVEQLAQVHIDLARWLAERRDQFPNQTVACFDIGALRYYSGFKLVDLGGILDQKSLAYRLNRATDRQVYESKPDAFISVENGFDYVPQKHGKFNFSLEYLRGWQYPEYLDPVPPHTKRLLLYRVNHCGQPRLAREQVGDRIDFNNARERSRRRWGAGRGKSFATWPTLRAPGRKRHGSHRGGGYLSSAHPTEGDKAEGVWESHLMKVQGQWLSLMLAGGRDEQKLRIELVDERGELLHHWSGYRTKAFLEEVLPLQGLQDRRVKLRVVDASVGRWGHINVDEIHQFNWVEQPAVDCPAPDGT
jgi:hypothetical protein